MEYNPEQVRQFFFRCDHNRDGYLSMREVFVSLSLKPKSFYRMDGNRDGIVSFVEFDQSYRSAALWGGHLPEPRAKDESAEAEATPEPNIRARFSMADKDADEQLGIEELETLLQEVIAREGEKPAAAVLLNRYDTNADFHLDREEIGYAFEDTKLEFGKPNVEGPEGASNPMAGLEEASPLVQARVRALLESIDRNENGALSRVELEDVFFRLAVKAPISLLDPFDTDRNSEYTGAELATILADSSIGSHVARLADGIATLYGGRMVPSVIEPIDRDRNERLSREELEKYLPRSAHAMPIENVMAFDYDTSGDLDLQEFLDVLRLATQGVAPNGGATSPREKAPDRPWTLLDINRDDTLSFDEAKAYLARHTGSLEAARDMFQGADEDGSGASKRRNWHVRSAPMGASRPRRAIRS